MISYIITAVIFFALGYFTYSKVGAKVKTAADDVGDTVSKVKKDLS